MTTRIKFCGITRAEDLRCAVGLGVDAIGFVLTRQSQRFVGVSQARAMRRMLPPFVSAVALFMDDEAAWVEEVIAQMQPDLLQFHGSETPGFAASFARPYIKAIPMASVQDVSAYTADYPDASGFLLDSHAGGGLGGRGVAFDWTRVPQDSRRHLVLAGGLDARNVAQAMALVRPYAVDVSSGIEWAPGIKDVAKMRGFIDAVRAADAAARVSPAGLT